MRTNILILSLFCSLTAVAQLPTDFRTEQIYLSLEKHTYVPGDTISMEGRGLVMRRIVSFPIVTTFI